MNWRQSIVLPLWLAVSAQAFAAVEYSAPINYQLRCAGCHGQDGMGVPEGGIPPFPGFVDGFFETKNSRLYLMHVPGINTASLSDKEIAEVMNYVVERWGNADHPQQPFTTEEVNALRAIPVEDVIVLRRQVTQELTARGRAVPDYPWP